MSTEKQKQSLYFPEEMLREVMKQSVRLDRSMSWTVQQAWRLAREELRKLPAAERRPSGNAIAEARPRTAAPSPQVLEFLAGKFDHDPVR